MNYEKQPPPSLDNIKAAIKFEIVPGGITQFGRSRLVASLHVGSSVWYSVDEANRHPAAMEILREKLKRHLLRQLFHDQRGQMAEAMDEFFHKWTPIPYVGDAAEARDKLMRLAAYTPPAGFDDDEFDCDRAENCGCEQFEFLLQPAKNRTS